MFAYLLRCLKFLIKGTFIGEVEGYALVMYDGRTGVLKDARTGEFIVECWNYVTCGPSGFLVYPTKVDALRHADFCDDPIPVIARMGRKYQRASLGGFLTSEIHVAPSVYHRARVTATPAVGTRPSKVSGKPRKPR